MSIKLSSIQKHNLVFKATISVGKNPSPTLARDKAKIEYINEGQPSPFELAFGVELGSNLHFKMVSKSILDPF